ncbi:hypothetical protein B0H11DRAFT_2297924 [Mycena galericulata]|nr:hypothetical protein B0H11DRAFT_2297924 [Mycena galericulata]
MFALRRRSLSRLLHRRLRLRRPLALLAPLVAGSSGLLSLNVQKHQFLQELMGDVIRDDVEDYWERFQGSASNMLSKDTSSMDAQHIVGAIDQLLSLNGWYENAYDDLVRQDHLYYIAIVIHSADHFLVNQLAVIVQMAKRLGTNNSMLDYDSTDSTETLTNLCEAVLTLLGVPFRIRRVPGMTEGPSAAYYPLEEAHMRNLALEPLHELQQNFVNEAAMVCGMDWAEHNGFFIFSDRWRTRDIDGDQFRQSKSSSKAEAVPPRDRFGASRYAQHLPFQIFCCESGTHVVTSSSTPSNPTTARAPTSTTSAARRACRRANPTRRASTATRQISGSGARATR